MACDGAMHMRVSVSAARAREERRGGRGERRRKGGGKKKGGEEHYYSSAADLRVHRFCLAQRSLGRARRRHMGAAAGGPIFAGFGALSGMVFYNGLKMSNNVE